MVDVAAKLHAGMTHWLGTHYLLAAQGMPHPRKAWRRTVADGSMYVHWQRWLYGQYPRPEPLDLG